MKRAHEHRDAPQGHAGRPSTQLHNCSKNVLGARGPGRAEDEPVDHGLDAARHPRGGGGRRDRVDEALARADRLAGALDVFRRGQHRLALGRAEEIEQDRAQQQVGERDVGAEEVRAFGDRLVEQRELSAPRVLRGLVDDGAVGLAVGAAGEDILHDDAPHHRRIQIAVDGADPLLHARAALGIGGAEARAVERLVDIAHDRARLVEREVAVPHRRHLAPGMQLLDGVALRRHRFERVGHAFLDQGHARAAHVSALRNAVKNEVGHHALPGLEILRKLVEAAVPAMRVAVAGLLRTSSFSCRSVSSVRDPTARSVTVTMLSWPCLCVETSPSHAQVKTRRDGGTISR